MPGDWSSKAESRNYVAFGPISARQALVYEPVRSTLRDANVAVVAVKARNGVHPLPGIRGPLVCLVSLICQPRSNDP